MIVSAAWQAIELCYSGGRIDRGRAGLGARSSESCTLSQASDYSMHATFPKRADQCFDYDNVIYLTAKHDHSNCA